MKVTRLYLRVSIDEQDLTRQSKIEHSTLATGARPDHPELLRMIADL